MELQEKVSLRDYTTYKIGGEADYFCVLKKQKDVKEVVDFAQRNKLELFFLGGGSNILFSDQGFKGVIARLVNEEIEIIEESEQKVRLKCGAGASLTGLAQFCAQHALSGLEWSVGIPGTVGGAVRGNAGAYGGEVKDSIVKVWAINTEDQDLGLQELGTSECDFAYRSSVFKENPAWLIWEVEMEFKRGDKTKIKEQMNEMLKKRNKSQPPMGQFPSAGCVFKNPAAPQEVIDSFEFDQEKESRDGKVPAGWLIDRCDLKGEQIGGAMVSREQANFIVNTGKATSEDVIILMSMIKMKVRNKFGVQLEEEIKVLL